MKVTIGIPAYNEEKNIAGIIQKLKKFADEIIVCDDGSTDLTASISKDLGSTVISHPKNLGYGAAIKSIFLKAKENNSDVLVTFDADGQHRVGDLDTILKPIIEKQSDIVIGSRFLNDNTNVPRYRKVGINVITKVTSASIKKNLSDAQSGFRAYGKKALSDIVPSDNGMGISTEILIKAGRLDLKIIEVPITIDYFGDTSTHNAVSHGTSVLISTIKFTSIEHPLKFYGVPAIIFLILGISFTYFAIEYYAEFGRLNTNITLLGAGTAIVGIVLLLTAVLLYTIVSVVREKR